MATPFNRAHKMTAAIQQLMYQFSGLELQRQMSVLHYESRGHGRGVRGGVNAKAYAKMRRHTTKPHQGERELNRLLRPLEVTSCRRWHTDSKYDTRGYNTRAEALQAAHNVRGFHHFPVTVYLA